MRDLQFSFPLRVYIEDVDPGGIVYHVNYLKFLERARTEYMRFLGFGRSSTFTNDLMFVVRTLEVSYLLPALLDDEIVVSTVIKTVRGASFDIQQSVLRHKDMLLDGTVSLAVIDRINLMPRRLPKEMRAKLCSEVFDTI